MTLQPLPQAPPESYVVRIYRRDPRLPTRVVGTVEVVASGNELGFKNLRELQRILVSQDTRATALAALTGSKA